MLSEGKDENSWQKFLRDYIIIANTSYKQLIEKRSLSLEGDYPDFILLNAYDYVDIFEIKKPTTKLLVLDKSRKNYYWAPEISKAISQVENYLHLIVKNSLLFKEEIEKIYGIRIRVVKPRGFIIAGLGTQLSGVKMEDDYRILNSSMKNVEVILYDDLLNSLKTFIANTNPEKRKE